jgi:hypothetical protein
MQSAQAGLTSAPIRESHNNNSILIPGFLDASLRWHDTPSQTGPSLTFSSPLMEESLSRSLVGKLKGEAEPPAATVF